jgi:polyphosphate kinase
VVTSIRSSKLRKYLKDRVLGGYLRDNVKARILQPDGTYTRVQPAEGETLFACQADFEIS